jgi:peroxiredoxin
MKIYFILINLLFALNVNAQQATLMPGAAAPSIRLKNVDDKTVSLNDYPQAKGFIIVFSCNTCPYAKAYEKRIIALNDKYALLGFPVIAVNPNDAEASPGDSFEKMKILAKAHRYNFPYLFDEGQVVTAQYGAKSTPHIFVVSKTSNSLLIEYAGAIDNDTPDTNPAKTNYAEAAVEALLQHKKPAVAFTKAIGCGVRWKRTN